MKTMAPGRAIPETHRRADAFAKLDDHVNRHLREYQICVWVIVAASALVLIVGVAVTPLEVLRQFLPY